MEITVTPSPAAPEAQIKVPDPSLWSIWSLHPGFRPLLFFGIIFTFISGASMPLFSKLFGDIYGTFLLPPDELKKELLIKCIYMVLVGVLFFFTYYPGLLLLGRLAENVLYSFRTALFSSLIRKPVTYFDETRVADLVTRISEDCNVVHKGVGEKVGMFFSMFSQFFLGMGLAFYESWRVSLTLLSLSPLLVIIGVIESKFTEMSAKQAADVKGESYAVVQQSFDAIHSVKAYSNEMSRLEKYLRASVLPFKLGLKRGKSEALVVATMMAMTLIVYGASFYISGLYIANGTATIPEVLAAFLLIMMAVMGLGTAMSQISPVIKSKAAAGSLYKLMHVAEDNLNETGLVTEVKGGIKLENITFRYPTRKDVTVLENFSLEIKPNTSVALVGTSGGGKSTIVNLVQRFYEPELGQVLIDNVPISDLNLTAFRRQVALVEQHPKLFSGTIRENILFGLFGTGVSFSEKELQEKVIKASKDANAYDFIMALPKGFDTELAEGKELSGGQMQRISIARALIREPKILLLDEPTSALDSQSERQVQEVLDEMMTRLSCTLIVIAHRLSTVKNASKIVVINRGLIAEGTHEELLETSEDYRKLTQGQMIGFADGSNSE
ncbi:hypothetical protein RCL1_007176 [Eukaryota sp. TZLM3-RCL]